MVDPNEVLTFILATTGVVFLALQRDKVRGLPRSSLLKAGYYCLYAGIVFSILEGFSWSYIFDFTEHVFYAASSVLLACWVWGVFRGRGGV